VKSGNIHSGYSVSNQKLFDTEDTLYEINPTVILVSNDIKSPSHSYRIGNFSQAYWELGVTNTILTVPQISKIATLPRNTIVVIFWRTSITLSNLPWFENARYRGIRIFYDNDDLTFDKNVYNRVNVHGLQLIPKETAAYLTETICQLQNSQIQESDLGIACTQQMASSFAEIGIPSEIIPIVIPRWMERNAKSINANKKQRVVNSRKYQNELKVIYASGSPSHGLDFESCFSGVVKFLATYPGSTLTILGSPPINENRFPVNVRSQVNFLPMVPHEKLLAVLSRYDVQIAPLEVGNKFVEAKSATKFMQGGAVSIPTIASPSLPFRDVIEHGINGIIASNDFEWYEALSTLLDPTLRLEMGRKANDTVLSQHTVEAIKPKLIKILQASPLEGNTPRLVAENAKKIYWLVPDFSKNSGGIRNIFNMASLAMKAGFDSKIVYHNSTLKIDDLRKLTLKHYGFDELEIFSAIPSMEVPYAVVAVHHSSVPWMKIFAPPKSKLVYLVQDFEPFFYPMSGAYIDTLSTYFDQDLQIITSLKWMSERIRTLTGREVPFLDFPMDKEIYRSGHAVERSGVIFYAKQDTPRRLYDLGIKSLQIINQVDPEIPITFFGGGSSPIALQNVINKYSELSNNDLAVNYRKHRVGMAFAPTNPSGIPYEMMACGLPVVDISVPGDTYNKYFDTRIHLCEPKPSELASEILSLINIDSYWADRSSKGLNFIESMQSREEIQLKLIEFLESL